MASAVWLLAMSKSSSSNDVPADRSVSTTSFTVPPVSVMSGRLPIEGTTTFFQRNDLRLRSLVVWVHGKYAGVSFDRPLKTEQVLRNVPKPKPKAEVDFRRPGLACRPLTDYERRMLERWMKLGD